MKIKVLGTRGEIKVSAPRHFYHSGILVDDKILFDIGEEKFLDYKPKWIFITHFHPDHAFFVTAPDKKAEIKVPIYSPENLKPEEAVRIDGYRIIPLPTIHSKKVKSMAYLIEKSKKRVLYTGDMVWIRKKYHHLFKNLDLVITEASFFRKGGRVGRDKQTGEVYGHTGIPDLINLFKKFTSCILFVHFGSWFYKDIKQSRKKIIELAKENGVKAIVGYDGLEVKI